MKTLLILIWLAAGSTPAWTVSGIVVDRESGLRPEDSLLRVRLGALAAQPDSEGAFSFRVDTPGVYSLKVESEVFTGEEKLILLEPGKPDLFATLTLHKRPRKPRSAEVTGADAARTGGRWQILGFVVEDKTELPLPGARLRYDGRKIPLDEKASFHIEDTLSGEHTFQVEHPGCQSLTQALRLTRSEPDPFVVLRVTDTGRVPVKREIVVSAKREPLHVTARPGSVTISRKEIERSTGTMNDPMRVLQTLPGVSATSDINSRPVIRGGDVLENRVSLDGIPLLQPYHFGGFKSIFNAAAMEKMTLHRDEMPAQFHNALSAITAVEARNPIREKEFDLIFDVNMLQYNAYLNLPIIKEKFGLNFSTQGSYMDWVIKRMMDLFAGKEAETYKTSMQLPDYLDFSAGAGYIIDPKSKLLVNGLYNTDRYHYLEPESLINYRAYFRDGTDSIFQTSRPAVSYYVRDPGFRKDSMYSDSVRRLSAVFHPDTSMYYRHAYSVLYGLWENQLGADQVLRTSLAWQRRNWNILFYDYSFLTDSQTRQRYDVILDQYNAAQSWIYSGLRNHLLNCGLQLDYTRQNYDVNLPRYLHEMVVKGSTNYADMWGPITGDSGFSPFDAARFLDDSSSGRYWSDLTQSMDERIQLEYSGNNGFWNASAYASDRWELTPRLTLNLGLRTELSLIDTSLTLSPRVSAHYSTGSRDEWFASVGHYTQNNYDFAHAALSEALRPEKTWHASAGWTHEFLPWLRQELSVYHKQYTHLITEEIQSRPLTGKTEEEVILDYLLASQWFPYDSLEQDYRAQTLTALQLLRQGNPQEFRRMYELASLNTREYYTSYSNSGTGYAQGVEYFLRYDPADFWSGWLSVSLSRSLRSRKPDWQAHPFPLDRALLLSMANYYRLPRAYEIGLRVRYMTGLPYTDLRQDYGGLAIGPYNAERYSSYLRFDFRIAKAFRLSGHKCHWYTELWNAFNAPNAFLRDKETDYVKAIDMNTPVPVLFMGVDFDW